MYPKQIYLILYFLKFHNILYDSNSNLKKKEICKLPIILAHLIKS